MIGDAFLVYPEEQYFLLGMLAFSLAQAVYISAFGWDRTKPLIGGILYTLGMVFLFYYINPRVNDLIIKVRGLNNADC